VHARASVLGPETLLSRGDEELALADGALWCDAVAFGQAEDEGRLAQALELYAGELLPGFHLPSARSSAAGSTTPPGAARARGRRRVGARDAPRARRAAHRGGALGAARGALRVGRRAGAAPRDHAARPLGDRAGALRLYDEFARRLRAEYEAEPSRETLAMAAALRTGAPLPEPAPRGGVGAS
jgi:serine/threonine-protein kinase